MKKSALHRKLFFAFMSVALIVIAVGLLGWCGVSETGKTAALAAERLLPEMQALLTLQDAQRTIDAASLSLLVPAFFRNEGMKNQYLQALADASQKLDDAGRIVVVFSKSGDREGAWNDVMAARESWRRDLSVFLDLLKSGNQEGAAAMAGGVLSDSRLAFEKQLSGYIDLTGKTYLRALQHAVAQSANLTGFTLIGSLCGAALALLLGVLLSMAISRPIRRTTLSLRDTVNRVMMAANQLSLSIRQQVQGIAEQASSVEETSSSLEEVFSNTKRIADQAYQAKAMMPQVSQIVQRVDRYMADLAAAVSEITRSSEETGQIVRTIDEIAFQTNLLALNAAIVAARVGEAGAAFAVVADEVRTLSMRASEAARNTNILVENTLRAVRRGNDLTQATRAAFRENAEISQRVSHLVDEIVTLSSEQSQGISQVDRAIAEMDNRTQQTAANAEQSAADTAQLAGQATQIKGCVKDLMRFLDGSTLPRPSEGNRKLSPIIVGNNSTTAASSKAKRLV